MIKLVVTDVDGTVTQESSTNINPEYFDVIQKLKDKGIIFVVASGRQSDSLKKTFPKLEKLEYLAENGTDIFCKGLKKQFLINQENYLGLIEEAIKLPKEFQLVSCSPGISYTTKDFPRLYDRFTNRYHYKCEIVDDLRKVSNICKVTILNENNIPFEVADSFKNNWSDKVDVAITGRIFLDFSEKGCNKGTAVKLLQEHLGISPDETCTFGDSDNDIPMFERAKYRYAVEDGTDTLKNIATEIILPSSKDGVLKKLKTFL